jgi:hypothetical protein
VNIDRMRRQVARALEYAPQPPPLEWHGPLTLGQHNLRKAMLRQREAMMAASAPLLKHALRPTLYFDSLVSEAVASATGPLAVQIACRP